MVIHDAGRPPRRLPHSLRRAVVAVVAVLAVVVAPATPLAPTPAVASSHWQDIGTSREGEAIRALLIGGAEAPVRVVVLGLMHGDEPAGLRVVERLRHQEAPPGTAIWLIPSMNPDGLARGTRTNARGVDLDRNFPAQWRAQGSGTSQWSGPSASSEPETRAVMDFLTEVRPTAILSFHQPFDVVDITHPTARRAGRLLARWMGVPARPVGCTGPCRGTLTEWATDELGSIAITVELPDVASRADIDRASTATLRLARWLVDRHGGA